MATAIAQLKALMGIDTAQAEKAVDNIGNKVKNLGSNQLAGLKGMIVGAFSAGALIAFGRNLLKVADDLDTTAKMVGITVESMVALKTISATAGLSTENLFKSLGRLKDSQGEVVAGNKTLVDALKQLNISEEEFVGLKVDDLLELLAKKYAEAGGSAEAFNGIVGIFGKREGLAMIEVLTRINEEGLAKLKDQTKDAAAGVIELAKASDALEKAGNQFILWGAQAVNALNNVRKAYLETYKEIQSRPMDKKTGVIKGFFDVLAEKYYAQKYKDYEVEGGAGGKAGKGGPQASGAPSMQAIKSVEDMAQASDRAALAKRKEIEAYKESEKVFKTEETRREKLIDLMEQQDKLSEDFDEKRKGIMAGKGIETPALSRVDSLQQIGGIIGGVAGAGSQEARIAERTAKMAEEMTKLQTETNRRLEQIENKIFELGKGE